MNFNLANFFWDLWCCLSVVGIWPRFIEPTLLNTTRIKIGIPHLPKDLNGLKIVQFSDLHLHPKVSNNFLKKIKSKIDTCQPDLIFFTGDFLCFSLSRDLERLETFFNSLHATYGCYAILGNHDYAEFISINNKGEYDVLNQEVGSFSRIFQRLWTKTILAHKVTKKAKAVKHNEILEQILQKTPFKLLKNESVLIPIKKTFLNVTGLEEYITGRCNPKQAFLNYNKNFPGIVLAHNPDCIPSLLTFPGEIILCGHTHGGQVNLPWLWKKFTLMENPYLKKGCFQIGDKWAYVNRGVGSAMQFRWFAAPEIFLLTIEEKE